MTMVLKIADVALPRAARVQLARARIEARMRFAASRKAEVGFLRQLRAVAGHIGALSRAMAEDPHALDEALRRYAGTLRPWAVAVARRMQNEVDRRDVNAWEALARSMGRTLRAEVERAPITELMRERLSETVTFITSMPVHAAERVQHLTSESVLRGGRAKDLQIQIARGGKVSAAHAMTIARTETSRNASLLTETRARFIGSPGYFWRTVGDSDVRDSHRALEGRFIPWNRPPVVDRKTGRKAHAGQDINDRCWPEPVIPDRVA